MFNERGADLPFDAFRPQVLSMHFCSTARALPRSVYTHVIFTALNFEICGRIWPSRLHLQLFWRASSVYERCTARVNFEASFVKRQPSVLVLPTFITFAHERVSGLQMVELVLIDLTCCHFSSLFAQGQSVGDLTACIACHWWQSHLASWIGQANGVRLQLHIVVIIQN